MREINVTEIENTVRDLCIKANRFLPKSLADCIGCAAKTEKSPTGREVLADLVRNIEAAEKEELAVCQDTSPEVRCRKQ